MVDVQQVKLQLFVGLGVVFAVDLGVACQAGLDLEPQIEIRHGLAVGGGDLGTLRPGTHHGHIPHEDVPQLGQLVQANLADEAANGGNAVVLVTGAEPGHPVLFGVLPHGAELQNFELFSVLGETGLLIEHGTPVIQVDGQAGDQHDGAQQQQGDAGAQQVEEPFDDGVLGGQGLAVHV